MYGGGKKPRKPKIKNVRNLFKLKNENGAIKDIMIEDIRNLLEQ